MGQFTLVNWSWPAGEQKNSDPRISHIQESVIAARNALVQYRLLLKAANDSKIKEEHMQQIAKKLGVIA